MKFISCLLGSLLVATTATAHSIFQDFWVDQTDKGPECTRMPLNNNPVTSVSTSSLACNANPSVSPGTCALKAGEQATVEMHAQPGDRSCSNTAIGGNHNGPVMVYMAKVDDALTADGSSAKWFKVAEQGYFASTKKWATDVLNSNCGKFSFLVPSCIAPGDYLVRAEVIALHVAQTVGGAQFYMSCYTVTVTGSGSTSPSTVSFPGAYSAQDPGILFDMYSSFTSYTIPGPSVFSCPGDDTTDVTIPTAAPNASPTPDVVNPAGTSGGTTSSSGGSSSSSGSAALYGQCGGQGWNGPTTCASGSCKAQSSYYSQCTP